METLLQGSLEVNRRYTVAEYEAMPEDGHQYQLIHGQLIMSPSPNWLHQGIIVELSGQIRSFIRGKKIGKLRVAPMDVFLGPHVVQPDVLFVSEKNSSRISMQGVRGAPDLVVEVLSPGTTRLDKKVKRNIYQKYGVREIWFVHPKLKKFEVIRQEGDTYTAAVVIPYGEVLTTPVLSGFSLDIAAVFDAE